MSSQSLVSTSIPLKSIHPVRDEAVVEGADGVRIRVGVGKENF